MIAAELRPPRAELGSREGMDAWIDMYHAVRSLARRDFDAVGEAVAITVREARSVSS